MNEIQAMLRISRAHNLLKKVVAEKPEGISYEQFLKLRKAFEALQEFRKMRAVALIKKSS